MSRFEETMWKKEVIGSVVGYTGALLGGHLCLCRLAERGRRELVLTVSGGI